MLQLMNLLGKGSFLRFCCVVLIASISLLSMLPAQAIEQSSEGESAQILQAFNKQHRETEHAKSITDKEKQRIMFLMGVVLFILVLITGGLGLAMGLYGKQVFVPHMLFAGLSVTMAIAHEIVGLVWFYPF
jgi:hypothetical protein